MSKKERKMADIQMIFMGWKDIASACGVSSIATIRRIARNYQMPVKFINRRPSISRNKLEEWWNGCDKGLHS